MEKWKLDLLDAVAESNAFSVRRTHERYVDSLRHLAASSKPADRTKRTGAALKELFLEGCATSVPVFIERLQSLLDIYFIGEGHEHKYRIRIIRQKRTGSVNRQVDLYALEYPLNGEEPLKRLFWEPHLDPHTPALIVYGVPMFVQSKEKTVFTRNVIENSEGAVKLKRGQRIAWPYVTLGDMECSLRLTRFLSVRGVEVKTNGCRPDVPFTELFESNSEEMSGIIVGSTRVNPYLKGYQRLALKNASVERHFPFRLETFTVDEVDERGRKTNRRIGEKKYSTFSHVPAVITRRAGAKGSPVTLIASNHGRAVHRVGEILTEEKHLRKLLTDPLLQAWSDTLPSQFQIVLRIRVEDDESLAGDYSVEAAWSDRDGFAHPSGKRLK